MSRSVLVVNAGSSSLKYMLIDIDSERTLASGLIERIGEPTSRSRHVAGDRGGDRETVHESVVVDHRAAMTSAITNFTDHGPSLGDSNLVAVGHRVVMGGTDLATPALIDDALVTDIEQLASLAPLHNPANAAAIEVGRELLNEVPHVAVFDTAFFVDLPQEASRYAIDRDLASRYGIRRYGFHGISHEYVSGRVSEILGRQSLRQIVLHLGNGASASAIVDGRAVDTSMGFTPLEGLVMGTRSGDIDPSIGFHLQRQAGMDAAQVDHMLNHRSGMVGLTGHGDMRDVHRMIAEGDEASALGLAIYARRLRKYIGAYAAVMGGLDAVTFTAGVGENDPAVRALAVEGLGFLGIEIDDDRNRAISGEPRIISRDGSPTPVLVVGTREELSIARQVRETLSLG